MLQDKVQISVAAQLTGISADRLRKWEERYKAIRPNRGPKGREYTERDLRYVLLLKEAMKYGYSIGRLSGMSEEEIRKLIGPASNFDTESWLLSLQQPIKAFDHRGAQQELERVAVLLGDTRELVHRAILPLARDMGRSWEDGSMKASHEHLVTMLLTNMLGGLLSRSLSAGYPVKLLLVTPREERHYFGLLAASLIAASVGLEPICLGTDLPAEEILFVSSKVQADVVMMATYGSWPRQHHSELVDVFNGLPRTTRLWLAGPHSLELKTSLGLENVLAIPDFIMFDEHLKQFETEALT